MDEQEVACFALRQQPNLFKGMTRGTVPKHHEGIGVTHQLTTNIGCGSREF